MNIFFEVTINILAGVLGGGGIVFLLKTFITEKIKGSIKNDYDNKLEEIRGKIQQNQIILNNVLSSQNQSFQLGQSERLKSVKILWENYLKIRSIIKMIVFYDDILLEEEFNNLSIKGLNGNDNIVNELKKLSYDEVGELTKIANEIENERPYLNEQIWLYVQYLITFNGRIIHLYINGCKDENIKHWKNDKALKGFVEQVLNSFEFETISKAKMSSIKLFNNFIEQKIMYEIHSITSGKIAADNSHEYALKIMELNKLKI